MVKRGRKGKYSYIIERLNDNTLYSPSKIAWFAWESRLLPNAEIGALSRLRLRTTLGRMTVNKRRLFPIGGDGHILIRGQQPTPGWYGWRWKEAYGVRQEGESCPKHS